MQPSNLSIKHAQLSDLPEIQKMFVDTISHICKADYSFEQIQVWTSSIENTERWTQKLITKYFLIALLDNNIVGFASLENADYLDFLYVHKDYQRQGIADLLYVEIEKEAIQRKASFLNSDVSETAKGFFEKKGFTINRPQTLTIKGVEIGNYKMTKSL